MKFDIKNRKESLELSQLIEGYFWNGIIKYNQVVKICLYLIPKIFLLLLIQHMITLESRDQNVVESKGGKKMKRSVTSCP